MRLRVDQGGRAEDVDALIRLADEGAAKRGPAGPLTNKSVPGHRLVGVSWLTNDGHNRKCRFEILTMPGVAQSLTSLLLHGEFR